MRVWLTTRLILQPEPIPKIMLACLAMLVLFCDSSVLAGEPKFLLAWGQRGDKEGEFYSPIQIAINPQDEVFVTDLNNARLQKFNAEGKYVGGFELPLDKPPARRASLAVWLWRRRGTSICRS